MLASSAVTCPYNRSALKIIFDDRDIHPSRLGIVGELLDPESRVGARPNQSLDYIYFTL